MCQHLEGFRSPIPPGYTGHQPGTLFKFGFGNPASERPVTAPDPQAFLDARDMPPPLPGEIQNSTAMCRVPFDAHRLSTPRSARMTPLDTAQTPTPWKRSELSMTPRSPLFRAEPPQAPPPTVGFTADEFPTEVKPVKYMEKKGRPTHFWPYYRPLGGDHLTPSPGHQYPPHPPDTVETRKMSSSYTNAFLKNMKKVLPGTRGGSDKQPPQQKFTREGMSGGYENNFTPLQAPWYGEEVVGSKKGAFSTSYKGAFTIAAVSPRRRKKRLGA